MKQKPPSPLPSPSRRTLLALCAVFLAGCRGSAPRRVQAAQLPLSAEDESIKRKFRGLEGGQLLVDSLFDVHGLNIFDEHGWLFFTHSGLTPPRGRARASYGADFGVPKFLRVEWRDPKSPFRASGPYGAMQGGAIIADHTIPVASRIPDALLEERRKNGGGFRLKIRLHPDGPLIGWDLERAPGSAPDGSKFHHPGGDFQEAYIYNGKVLRKGWYIHPRSGERIETDF
ncbi:MAG: hypothetical protein Q7J47_00355 [Azoarcus sp.]|nr:hypothetical protein [Azoarcus sp.]